ncbi:unnamed protein product [Paramecium sonneborni]|uniref:Uncharacterized protein n=1 Tax=Paramecium sonneborni TaxID=65129 RepID=A0A8S1PJY3_9CILI|nr:unnamed protein product [Paramecium sonneborni]
MKKIEQQKKNFSIKLLRQLDHQKLQNLYTQNLQYMIFEYYACEDLDAYIIYMINLRKIENIFTKRQITRKVNQKNMTLALQQMYKNKFVKEILDIIKNDTQRFKIIKHSINQEQQYIQKLFIFTLIKLADFGFLNSMEDDLYLKSYYLNALIFTPKILQRKQLNEKCNNGQSNQTIYIANNLLFHQKELILTIQLKKNQKKRIN